MERDNFNLNRPQRTVEEIVLRERALFFELAGYKGLWVALFDSEVIASAKTQDELITQLGSAIEEVDTIMQVPEKNRPSYFYSEAA